MLRRIGVAAAIVLVAAGLAVPAAQAKAHMLVGIQDDAMTLRGNPTFTFPTLKQLRTQIVRINLNWNDVAKRRPAHAQDPADPAYDWDLYDRAISYAAQYGMQVLLTILFTPSWANGGRRAQRPAEQLHRPAQLRVRGRDSLQRPLHPEHRPFDEVYLPAVKYWLAWNEPNNPNWLQQTSGGRFTSPRSYARICTAIWQGVHFTNFAGEKVACGGTGPRGNNAPRSSRPSLSPIAFMTLAKRAGLRNLDAYAHHPYYGKPSETPATQAGRKRCDARKHQHAHRCREQAVGQEANLDHRVRLADTPDPMHSSASRLPDRRPTCVSRLRSPVRTRAST